VARYRPTPEPWTRAAIPVVRGLAAVLSRPEYRGRTGLPMDTGLILAANHHSNLDPVLLARFTLELGRIPRFLAKNTLFDVPVLGTLLRGARQIPVYRHQENAAAALEPAVDALRRGELVIIYPEGTITRDPQRWPMVAYTGVARLALAAQVPVLPVAQWGAQEIVGRGWRVRPRRMYSVLAGEVLDLPAMRGRGGAPDAAALRSLTATVMERIRDQLVVLRGEPAPELVWDPRQGTRTARGYVRTEGPAA
jgi:1-acyl-sn-glycerol-3-phosphate acyltransferase